MLVLAATAITFSAFQSFQVNNTSNAVPEANFVNFESAHVHPLDMTPDATKLLAVNTANNSLEVFQVQDGALLNIASIPVGMDPVTVRVLDNSTAWVVNNVSDNISIVDLSALAVTRSIRTENEPSDVVFAGTPQKAFVSCAERESIQVFDLSNLDAAPTEVLLKGEQPRAMAVSADGSTVYTAFFESGNQTTVVPGSDFMASGFSSPQGGSTSIANDVRNVNGPYGGVVPVPNNGTGFMPPMNPVLPVKDDMQSLVVRKNSSGQWMDDNGGDWTNIVSGGQGVRVTGWDVLDNDVAVLNANSLALSYQKHLGNILMAMDVNPVTGKVTIVGTDATNEVRFEPNLRGVFLRVNLSQFTQGSATNDITDLNDHLTYASHTVPLPEREKSIGDPRAIAWKSDGTKAYIAGMGSNNIITVDPTGARTNPLPIKVGEGPTGIVLDETRNLAFVLNRFSGTVSTLDMTNDQQIAQTEFFDPTPTAIKVGRKHLYNTHIGSGNGHISCGSCHVDGKWDRLAWDLGNPAGDMEVHDTVTFHPLKGLKTTQFLIDILNKGTGKLHWRGDRDDFFQFAGAFEHLQGLDAAPDSSVMQEFMDFLATTYHVPNPYRPFRPETQSAGIRLNPNRVRGPGTSFQTIQTVTPIFISINNNCSHCHLANTGRGVTNIQPGNDNMGADLRSTYKKTGFWFSSTESTAGFGLMSDGAFETKYDVAGTSDYFGDYEGELLAFAGGIVQSTSPQSFNFNWTHTSQDSHAAVGLQETINGTVGSTAEVDDLKDLAEDYAEMGMIVTGVYQGEQRGFYYLGEDSYQSDVAAQTVSHTDLMTAAQAANGEALSWMLVHDQVKERAVDRNMDGTFDGDDSSVKLVMRSRLQGAHVGSGDMANTLIQSGLLPSTDPYASGMIADDGVMVTDGSLSPVDWMEVELRDATDPSIVVAYKSVILLRNGNIVEPGGEQVLSFDGVAPGDYYVAVRHRNHLGAMTASDLVLGEYPELVDFTDVGTATYGTDAQHVADGYNMLWMGDVNGDGSIKYTGSANDRDVVLLGIGGAVPTNVVSGYAVEDANLDGQIKYIGSSNDRDPILLNIGGAVPTLTRSEQLP